VIDDEECPKLYMIMEYADLGQLMEYDWNENNYFRRKKAVDFVIETISKFKDTKGMLLFYQKSLKIFKVYQIYKK